MTSRPAVPGSETPETDEFSNPSTEGDNDSFVAIEHYNSLLEHARSLERRLSLAQTEIKGHMRVKDDLEAGVIALRAECDKHYNRLAGLLFSGSLDKYTSGDVQAWAAEYTEKLDQAQARIAELEKDWETDADYVRMAERIKELEKLLSEAMENLIWCGGSADFGWGGKAQIGYDKGPRATIAAIHAALKSRA